MPSFSKRGFIFRSSLGESMWLVTKPMPSTRLFLPMTNRASDFSLHTTYTLSPGLSESYVEMSLKPFAWAISSAESTRRCSPYMSC